MVANGIHQLFFPQSDDAVRTLWVFIRLGLPVHFPVNLIFVEKYSIGASGQPQLAYDRILGLGGRGMIGLEDYLR